MAIQDEFNTNEFGNAVRPSWLPSIDEYRTPGEDWQRFTSNQNPFWSTRAPMQDIGSNLQARYLLGAPDMTAAGRSPTFANFLADYKENAYPSRRFASDSPDYRAQTYDDIRNRAQQAATASVMAPGAYLSGAAPGTADWDRRAWLSQQFGSDAANAQQNQLAVANLLALQNRGKLATEGPEIYRGQMANAVRNSMERLQQHRTNQGAPRESFLQWYLNQTAE
jgi:hypothetical protein